MRWPEFQRLNNNAGSHTGSQHPIFGGFRPGVRLPELCRDLITALDLIEGHNIQNLDVSDLV